jgi:hypothetical protein
MRGPDRRAAWRVRPLRIPTFRLGVRTGLFGLVGIGAVGLVAIAAPDVRETVIRVELTVAGGVIAWIALGRVRSIAAAPSSIFLAPADPGPQATPEIGSLLAVDTDVRMAAASRFGVETRLKPTLRSLAAARLARSRGIDLDSAPVSARRLIGDDLWDLIAAAPAAVDDRAPGVPLRQIERAVAELEAL